MPAFLAMVLALVKRPSAKKAFRIFSSVFLKRLFASLFSVMPVATTMLG